MIALTTPAKAQKKLAEQMRERRLLQELTQEGLAARSAVSLASLRKFERTGIISLSSFLKLALVLGGLEDIIKATEVKETPYKSLTEVLAEDSPAPRQRGWRK